MAHNGLLELLTTESQQHLEAQTGDEPPTLQYGPYEIHEVIGRGGMAVVHKARRAGTSGTGEQFAIKRIAPEFASSPSFRRMFCREALLGSQLEHSNVVRVIDFGEQDGELLLVTEYVDGTSCQRILKQAAKWNDSFPVPVALYIACEVLDALAYIHDFQRSNGSGNGIVHRDVSPGNIFLGSMGEVKLGDFGVARHAGGKRDTTPGTLKGKIGYMSPEQVRGCEVDGRSDLFSLGVVIIEMLTGTPFFTGKDDFEVLERMQSCPLSPMCDGRNTSVPFELRLVLATALALDPVERFWDAQEFSHAIRTFARHAGITLDRTALVGWLRAFDIWPARSGTYSAVRVDKLG
jgi:serine/threonine-protein kinase